MILRRRALDLFAKKKCISYFELISLYARFSSSDIRIYYTSLYNDFFLNESCVTRHRLQTCIIATKPRNIGSSQNVDDAQKFSNSFNELLYYYSALRHYIRYASCKFWFMSSINNLSISTSAFFVSRHPRNKN